MGIWDIVYDAKADLHTHTVPPGVGHTLLFPLVANLFATVRVSAFLYHDSDRWWRVHAEPSLVVYDVEHGKDWERQAYNARCVAQARHRRQTIRGEFGGYSDFFAPVVIGGQVAAFLVAGPVARARPTGEEIRERWRMLTGRQARLGDAEFAAYLDSTLDVLVLEGSRLGTFEALLSAAARLMGGEGVAQDIVNQVEHLRQTLEPVRLAERTWEAVQTMLDDRSQRTWSAAASAFQLHSLGLARPADSVLVGLAVSREASLDPIEKAVRLDALQRAAVGLARQIGNVVAGRVGDHGVVFLSAVGGGAARKKQRLDELAQRALALARRYRLSLHFGIGAASPTLPLSRSYQSALAAAERALSQGTRIELAQPSAARPREALRLIRRELGRAVEEQPSSLGARFDRYLEAVVTASGHRLEAMRGDLEAGFEFMSEPLLRSGALDQKSFHVLAKILDHAADEAQTTNDLFAAYRQAVSDLSSAIEAPVQARQDRSLRRALDYIHQHYPEALDFEKVSSMAGFAPSYFSHLFKEREGISFERYVLGLRVERAKQLLANSKLEIARVAELSGFNSAQYFCRAFGRVVGRTPREYRKRPASARARTLPK
ncbi:MAG TPA: AraC family transcriptional regulator [Polyangiaceae bacterium]|nr:AraC family transcriptional regulator [Polyangiaceae bacterium]